MKVEGDVLLGIENSTTLVEASAVNEELSGNIENIKKRVKDFSKEKRKLHHFVVRELPGHAKPMSLKHVSAELKLPLQKVSRLVEELEQEKTFLFRNNSPDINWAYPVSVEKTPHQVTFSTGEKVNAA